MGAAFFVTKSTAPLIEVWIKPFQRFAGSQGRALSRPSQRAESPFDSRYPTRESIQTNKKGKTVPSDGLSKKLRDLRVALFFFILVDSGQKTGIKGAFRGL
ncbi:hypothetical protein [Butyricicoccus pullicaecorum]|uniref:hypothetical protein n=1 Tax=Butyricicoccus pullicaecorum TaxID=501571 RepID=UPI00351FB21F